MSRITSSLICERLARSILRSSAICSLVRAYCARAEARPAVAKNAAQVRPACRKSCASPSKRQTWKICAISTASAAKAAWKKARRPRVMRPAAASDTSRITPMPLLTPPLAYMSMVIATTSATTPAVTCSVRFGSRMRAGTTSASATMP